jgi:hypothetical protein
MEEMTIEARRRMWEILITAAEAEDPDACGLRLRAMGSDADELSVIAEIAARRWELYLCPSDHPVRRALAPDPDAWIGDMTD